MKKPMTVFLISSLVLAAIFFLLPINLFDGVIEYEEAFRSYKVETRLSLSYFVGIGYDPEDMLTVKDFYLTTQGILTALILIVGLPALIAYRIYLDQLKRKGKS